MIKLISFEVQAYRSCKKTELLFDPRFTALIGANGSGKSNLMNAVLLLKKAFFSHYSRHFIEEKSQSSSKSKIKVSIDYNGKPIYLSGTIVFETDERNTDDLIDG